MLTLRDSPAERSAPERDALLRAALRAYPMDPGLALHRAAEALRLRRVELAPPILDLGCHDGVFAGLALARPGARGRLVGCDRDVPAVRRAVRAGAHRALLAGEAGGLPFQDGAFGTVVCNSVLTHVDDLEDALAEIQRVLQPGGRLIASVPTPRFHDWTAPGRILRRVGLNAMAQCAAAAYDRRWHQRHLLGREAWAERLRRAGLELERWEEYLDARASFLWSALFLAVRLGVGRANLGALLRRVLPAGSRRATLVETKLAVWLGPHLAAAEHGGSAWLWAVAGPARPSRRTGGVARSRTIRVGVDARPLMVTKTGVETYLAQMIRHLVASDADLVVRLFSDRPWPNPNPWGGARCAPVVVEPRARIPRVVGDGWILRDLPRELAAAVDVFFSASTKFPPGRTPVVVTVHDLGWRGLPAAYTRQERLRQYLWTRWAAQRATRLIAVSEFTRGDLLRWVPSCAGRVRVIHEAAEPTWRRVEDPQRLAAVRARLGLEGPLILAVGTLSPKKNLESLIDAFARLAGRGFPHRLVLVGRVGWKADGILARARRTPGVCLAGYVEDEALAALYSASDLFVAASRYEGFGLPVLEAMACGVPVVAARAGALPEVAADSALLCDPTPEGLAAAMQRALGDPGLRADLVSRGRDRVAAFTWARAARDLAAVLAEAAEARA